MLEEEIVKLRQAVQALTAQLANSQVAPAPAAAPAEPKTIEEPVIETKPVAEDARSKNTITMAELHEMALVVSREKGPKFVKSILGNYGGKRIGVIDATQYPAIKAAFEKALAE
jgi:hypothetical protein